MDVLAENIPTALKKRRQWVLWKELTRDGKLTKIPFRRNGETASSTDPETWDTFESVLVKYEMGGFAGVGYVFSKDDPYCGIDLDGCALDKKNVQPWAIDILSRLDTYAEWSPSGCGIKLICEAKLELPNGKNRKIDEPQIGEKLPGIEIYDHSRFFTLTGQRGGKCPHEPQPRQAVVDALSMEYWPVETAISRCRKYVAAIEPAISGQGGSRITSKVAVAIVKGFGLNEQQGLEILREFSNRCEPPWSERDLVRKIQWAQKQGSSVGYLRDANSSDWHRIPVEFTEQASVSVGAAVDVCVAALDELDQRGQRTAIAALQARYR